MRVLAVFLALAACYTAPVLSTELLTDPNQLTLTLGDSSWFLVVAKSGSINDSQEVFVDLVVNHPDILEVSPKNITFRTGDQSGPWNISVRTLHNGHAQVATNVTPPGIVMDADGYVDVQVELVHELGIASYVVGWIYFAAWSVSFYPQLIENFRRKSVVGLNFDFLCLNFVGFTLYSLFNCGLFWSKVMEDQYHARYPRSANPVFLNDVVFSLHALAAIALTIVQCFIYERGGQTVSITARTIIGIFGLIVGASAICAAFNVLLWLDFLYICSYVKLTTTLIKYIPQAYMNYKRKSTIGWSIGNIFLDFTGGALSMMQMIINAYNLDDWVSIFGDPTKFGLGLFSVIFDIFFIVQHFVLYRERASYEELPGENYPGVESEEQNPEGPTAAEA